MTSVVYQRTATSNNALGIGEVPTNDRDESCAIRSELVTNSPNGRLNVGWTKEPRHFGTRKIYIPDSRIDCEGAHSAIMVEKKTETIQADIDKTSFFLAVAPYENDRDELR